MERKVRDDYTGEIYDLNKLHSIPLPRTVMGEERLSKSLGGNPFPHISVGRSSECGIPINIEFIFSRSVSRHHGNFILTPNGTEYQDTSKKGTIIDGKVSHGGTVSLKPGDEILLAEVYQLSYLG
jgi:pSer/pThr/pTyr-binding forkhead associated (FHA) protein